MNKDIRETLDKLDAMDTERMSGKLADSDIDEILDQILSEPIKENPLPTPSTVKVGMRVRFFNRVASPRFPKSGRIGTVLEVPGPSTKYGGRDAERFKVRLEGNVENGVSNPTETIWCDNDGIYTSLVKLAQPKQRT